MKKPANGTGSRKAARLRVGGKSAARTGKKLGGRAMADKKATGDGAERNVDQIRDILFGGQMRDYERRFVEFDARLEAELARLRDAEEKRLAQIDKRIDESLDKLGKLLRQEIQDRNRSLDDLESRIQQAARTSRSEVATSLDAHAAELAATDERLRSAVADVAKATYARAGETEGALARLAADLRDEKVGREDLAALLAELALRLRGDFDLPPSR
jgi:DNA repair exonuclease SbcCD ATPase subunit